MNVTEAAIEEGVMKKYIFFKIAVLQSINLIEWSKYLKIPVTTFNFSKIATLTKTGHFHRHILIRLALI